MTIVHRPIALWSAIVAFAVLFGGCFPPPSYVDITQKGKIALVSFAMDKSVTGVGGEKDTGPGLLQKIGKGSQAAEEKYFEHQQGSVDAMWSLYKEGIRDVILGASLVDIETVSGNAEYQELTKHVPKMVMGTDVAPGANMLAAEGMGYVSESDTEKLDKLAGLLGADCLLLVHTKMNYDSSNAVLSIKTSHINLATDFILYQRGSGVVDRESFKASSDERISLVLGKANPEDYEKCVGSAAGKVLEKAKEYYTKQKAKAAEQAQAAPKE
jgi:hypothetical protein